ncbi:MAG: zf-HC2 domain-containing protein [Candidatus Levybacteria bacterium]|nr:zf-HC2 domain-containing protein [Candidatus Levybacteria bacterium]
MKTISCRQAVTRIFELLLGKLSISQKKELDEHLRFCKECCNRLEFEKTLKEKLQNVSKQTKVPNSLEKRIARLLRTF